MNDNKSISTSPALRYWAESRRPLTSLVFISPLLVIYETGILVLGPAAVRNGVDVWLRYLLEAVGFGQYFLLPGLTVCILLAWHHTTRQPWRLSGTTLYGMAVESLALAVCLRLVWEVQGTVAQAVATSWETCGATSAATLSIASFSQKLIVYLGAGIYEELLFRLILLSGMIGFFRWMSVGKKTAVTAAVILTSLGFATAHYVGPYGEGWDAFSFLFRFLAGIFFSTLFLLRGFGIAAGTHAGYDILVGLP